MVPALLFAAVDDILECPGVHGPRDKTLGVCGNLPTQVCGIIKILHC